MNQDLLDMLHGAVRKRKASKSSTATNYWKRQAVDLKKKFDPVFCFSHDDDGEDVELAADFARSDRHPIGVDRD